MRRANLASFPVSMPSPGQTGAVKTCNPWHDPRELGMKGTGGEILGGVGWEKENVPLKIRDKQTTKDMRESLRNFITIQGIDC